MLKKLFLLACIACCFRAYSQNAIDVLHYKFSIELSDNSDTIYGRAEIRLRYLTNSNSVKFDIVCRNEKGIVMIVDKIDGKDLRGFSKNIDSVTAYHYKPQTAGDTATYIITYHGMPADGLIISRNKFGNRTFFADNWPNRAHNWIPCNDNPADKATVEFLVTAPAHYQVISNGVQVEESNLAGGKKLTHYREDVALPTKVMVIGVADFAVNLAGDINCIPIYTWVFPENKAEGFPDYAIARDILNYHINYIGPFPYKKLANVQSKTIFGGMENAGAIFYYENSVTGKKTEESLISHEIVHQWFGDNATEKSFAHLWLSEGFATYLTHVYIESKYGVDSLSSEMRTDRMKIIDFGKSKARPVVDSTKNYMELLNANSYEKGSWVLHMLRKQLGDEVFHKGIRLYYATYGGKNADTKDFQAVMESVSGKKLDPFFQQWLYTAGNPSLDISWKYDAAKKQVLVNVKQLQSYIYQLPLTISIINASGAGTNQRVQVTKQDNQFVFSFPDKPKQLAADPFTELLFSFTMKEIK